MSRGWERSYVGLMFGSGQLDGVFTDECGCGASADASTRHLGTFFGHDWLVADRSWVGIEGDVGYDWRTIHVAGTQVGTDLTGSIRMRLGEEVGPALVYAAAGWTAARTFVKDPEDKAIAHGLTLGLGVDWSIDDATFLRAEYRYNNYSPVELSGVKVDLARDIFSIGIARRF